MAVAMVVVFAASAFAGDAPALKDINKASADDISAIQGIGKKVVNKILEERAKGEFKSMKDLKKIKGIGDKTYMKLICTFQVPAEGPLTCTFKAPGKDDKKVNLNTADESQLDGLPGLGKKKVEFIIKHRTEKGWFKKPGDLDQVKGFGEKNIAKLLPYIETEVDVNSATAAEFKTLGFANAEAIVKARDEKGGFGGVPEIGQIKDTDPKVLEAATPILVAKPPKMNK
jgi:competence ComEA-like helix-hairpin-helix protein